ncbi:MAG: BatA and WFA domain-containing protein [Planctomycetales bacterium]|nr:BatA and WFA domain-containing protein [Planctomycetales bacterium]
MSFAVPSALLLTAIAVPIIALYILKVRLRRVPVSTNMFWRQIYDEKPPRSIWQYLRHLLSLLMQLLLLTLMVLAVADPYFPWQLLEARRVVLVLDNSASMRAALEDGAGQSRWQAAVDAAGAEIEGLRFRDEAAIVLAGPRPEVVLGMSNHVPTLRRALRSLEPSDNPTELASAIQLGRRLIDGHAKGRILVFTDGCAQPLDADGKSPTPLAASSAGEGRQESANSANSANGSAADADAKGEDRLAYRIFGQPLGNVGITQFQARRSLVDPLGYELLAAVRNAGPRPVRCRLEVELDGHTVDVLPLKLAPDGHWSRALEKTSLDGGVLTARLAEIELNDDSPAGDDVSKSNDVESKERASDGAAAGASQPVGDVSGLNALATDDEARAVLPPRKPQHVTLVTEGNLFLQKVFEANPLVTVTVVPTVPDAWDGQGVLVLHRLLPETLPAGNVLVIDPIGPCDLWDPGDPLANPIITRQDRQSPLMAHVRLDNVLMPQARRLQFKQPPHALATALEGDIVYAQWELERGKRLALTVDLDSSDLAFRTAFPIMMANALSWMGGDSGELMESLPTGAVARLPLDALPAAKRWRLLSPAGEPAGTVEAPPIADSLAEGASVGSGGGNAGDIEPSSSDAGAREIPLGPFAACGIWTLVAEGVEQAEPDAGSADDEATPSPERMPLAVNLADERETDLRADEYYASRATLESATARWLTRPIWFYLVGMVTALCVLEWFMYQRRVIS